MAYLAFSCAGKNKKIRSVRSVLGNKNILIIGLELFILSRVRTSFGIPYKNSIFRSHVGPPSIFFIESFPDYSRVITDIHDLFIETTDVGD